MPRLFGDLGLHSWIIWIAVLATLAGAVPIAVTDSADNVIDPDFTYEVVDGTCSPDIDYLAGLHAVTTEHTAASGETIYFTRFGGLDEGKIGKCNYIPATFLAAYNPAGDFQMANTAQVTWSNNKEKEAIGLNFLLSADDSQVLGVPTGCDYDAETPVQITSTSELTLEFGFYKDKALLIQINNVPGDD